MRSRTTAARILEEALALPPPARATLAGKLLDSIDDEKIDLEYEAAWGEEIARHLTEIDSGRAKLIPWSQVRRDVLRSRRAKKRRSTAR